MAVGDREATLTEPLRYWDQAVFDEEQSVIESHLWNMVGLVSDIPKRNDYLTVTVAKRSVIVQNFDAGIRAFDNVCGHRSCRIRSATKGNGVVRCPYHSWTFGADGVPIAIPGNDELFGITEEERPAYGLKPWQVAICGNLIFVRKASKGLSLEEDLGALFPRVAAISLAFGKEMVQRTFEYEANWKVCVENTLDEYHAAFVHPTTFRPLLGSDFQYAYFGDHSTTVVRAQDGHLSKWNRLGRLLSGRPIIDENYSHFLLFPLTTLASTFGATFSLQTFVPLTPTRTRLVSRLFLSTGITESSVSAMMGDYAQSFNQQVFEEDQFVCEQMQLGLQQCEGNGVVGGLERRLIHFQRTAGRTFGSE